MEEQFLTETAGVAIIGNETRIFGGKMK